MDSYNINPTNSDLMNFSINSARSKGVAIRTPRKTLGRLTCHVMDYSGMG